jgi:hypothetical protein
LLDRIDGVGASVGKANDLGIRRLRLQQKRRKSGLLIGARTAPNTSPPVALMTSLARFRDRGRKSGPLSRKTRIYIPA